MKRTHYMVDLAGAALIAVAILAAMVWSLAP